MEIDYLDRDADHRYRRSLEITKLNPGESCLVDGIEYFKPKQACVNCKNLTFRNDLPFCIVNHTKININKIDTPRNDCEFWDFRKGD